MVACRTPVNRDESGERPSLNGWTALAKGSGWKIPAEATFEATASPVVAAAPKLPDTEAGPDGTRQTLIEGVKPVSNRDRIAVQAAKPMRGGNAAAGGMFDDTVRNQRDIFDRAYDASPSGWQALARAW